MLIKDTFLARFLQDGTATWIEVVPGRAAVLRLAGEAGNLDIVTVYLPTGAARDQRRDVMAALMHHLRPSEEALTVLLGDWNFVKEVEDPLKKNSNIAPANVFDSKNCTGNK